MITRIKETKNIAPFGSDICSRDCPDFTRINIVYGYNGSGKTMLSNIFSLLSPTTDTEHLALNLRGDATQPIAVKLDWDGRKLDPLKGKKAVFVFNSLFVGDHVYDGSESHLRRFSEDITTQDQLKNPKLKVLDDKIAVADAELTSTNSQLESLRSLATTIQTNISKKWNARIPSSRLQKPRLDQESDFPDSSSIKPSQQIETDLNAAFDRHAVSQRSQELTRDLESLESQPTPALAFDHDILTLLRRDVAKDAGASVRAKLAQYGQVSIRHSSVQQWFEDGARLLESAKSEATCPLCNSKLDTVQELLAEYNAFFSNAFSVLQKSLTETTEALDGVLRNLTLADSLAKTLTSLAHKGDVYKSLSNEKQVALSDYSTSELRQTTGKMKKLVAKKQGQTDFRPSESDEESIAGFSTQYATASTALAALISVRDSVIGLLTASKFDMSAAKRVARDYFWAQFDEQAQTAAKSPEEKNKRQVLSPGAGLKRFRSLGARSEALKKSSESLKHERRKVLASLRDESLYVNTFLHALGVRHLQIQFGDSDSDEIRILYTSGNRKTGISFSLSEGEKTALAFAYFLSKIKYEVMDNPRANLSDHVIIIDDPISSLDENRLAATALIIRSIFTKEARQLFVLSHDLVFLKHFASDLDKPENDARADFYIEGGCIQPLPKSLQNYQTSYFYKLGCLHRYRQGQIEYDAARDFLPNYIRQVLETFLSFKLARLSQGSSGQRYLSAGLDRLIRGLSSINCQRYSAVGDIKSRDDLVAVLQQLKRQVDPESHGTPQDLTEFEYISRAELDECCKNALDAIAFLDQTHSDSASQLLAGETQEVKNTSSTPE